MRWRNERVVRNRVRLLIGEHLHAIFESAQETVRGAQDQPRARPE